MSTKRFKKSVIYTALIWGLLILIMARVTVFVRKRATGDFDVIDASALFGVLLVGVLGLALLLNKRTFNVLRYTSRMSLRYLLVYFFLCFVSSLWSWNLPFTAFRAVEVFVVLVAALVVMSYSENFVNAERAFLRFAMLGILFDFSIRIRGGFSLDSLHTNLYTIMAGMGLVYCFAEWFNSKGIRRKFLARYAVIFLILLILGTSSASNIATASAFLIVLLLLRVGKVKIIPILVGTILLLFLSGSLEDFLWQILLPGKDMETALRLTGRDYLWAAYWELFQENPLYGYGYAVVARYGEQFGILGTTNAHNGLFEVILGTGLIGLSFFFFWVLQLTKELLTAYRLERPGAVGGIGAFVVIMINNMSKSIVGGSFDASFAVFCVFLGFVSFHVYGEVVRRKRLREPRDVNHRQ